MKPNRTSLDSESRKRLREILAILIQHDVIRGLTPEKLRDTIEDLGPTFVKIGQIMSMRQDMLPPEYCDELTKLRTEVAAMPFSTVKSVIESEYGKPLSSIFAEIDPTPLGSASIAQVHAAVLRDSSRVVVKVQRPDIHDTMARDIALLRHASGLLRLAGGIGEVLDFDAILDEVWFVAQEEMDFLMEAHHADEFSSHNRGIAYIGSPKIYHPYTTSRVLVMEYIDGIPIDHIPELTDLGYDLAEIGSKLAENYVKQIIDDGFFHADPHPGNIRVRGGQIIWIDLGMMGRLSKRDQELLRKAVYDLATSDVAGLKDVVLSLGIHSEKINHATLYTDLDDLLLKYGSLAVGDMDMARILDDLLSIANEHQISMPKGISMLSRGIMTIEGTISMVSPSSNLVEIVKNHLSSHVLHDVDWKHELKESGRALLKSSRKALDLPSQLSDILKMTIKGQTKVNLDLTGSEQPLHQIDHMVNKLILCIIIAALFVGSSLLCLTEMRPTILDIPAIAFFGFLAATLLSVWLFYTIARKKKR